MPTRRLVLALLAARPLAGTVPLAGSALPAGAARAAEAAGEGTRALAGDLYAADPLTGLALAGLDPVSYFLAPEPRAGDPAVELAFAGVVWRFASRANRAAFAAEPDVYLPRLGGYDPVGVAQGRIVNADPRLPARLGDRLYLFRAREDRERIDAALIARAEAGWPALRAGR